MAFCASCGAEVQGKFCAKCGAPVSGSAAAAQPPGATSPPPGASAAQAGLEENVAAALCYLLLVLTGVLFLVLEPYNRNPTIRFHAFQSIFAWLAAVILGMALSMFFYPINAVPIIGWIVYILVWVAFWLGGLALWLFLMYKAYNKERVVLPVVGPLAEKQAQPPR